MASSPPIRARAISARWRRNESRDPVLRIHVMRALRDDPEALLQTPEQVDGVTRTLGITDESARLHAAKTLAAVPASIVKERDIRALQHAVDDDPSTAVREAAAAALSKRLPEAD